MQEKHSVSEITPLLAFALVKSGIHSQMKSQRGTPELAGSLFIRAIRQSVGSSTAAVGFARWFI